MAVKDIIKQIRIPFSYKFILYRLLNNNDLLKRAGLLIKNRAAPFAMVLLYNCISKSSRGDYCGGSIYSIRTNVRAH